MRITAVGCVHTLVVVFSAYTSSNESIVYESEVETVRFGLSVGRLLVPLDSRLTDRQISNLCGESACDLVIVRASTRRTELFQTLVAEKNRRVLHADTLRYFSWALEHAEESGTKSTPPWVIDSTSSFEAVQVLVRDSFIGYRNHYSENPRLSESATLDGYLEWARTAMGSDTSRTFVARDPESGRAVGFVLANLDMESQSAEILLNGVTSEFRRRGVYRACIVGAAQTMMQVDGVKRIVISTQSSNIPVIEAWRSLGLQPWFSINTFHVMREGM